MNEIESKRNKWIYLRDGEVRAVFDNRKEVVEYFKNLLKQTLNDFDKQDKNDEYDYSIIIPLQEFKPMEYRPSYLSLL